MELSAASCQALLDAARRVICAEVGRAEAPGAGDTEAFAAGDLPATCAELDQPAGCFVSLHCGPDRALRGCVGHLDSPSLWRCLCKTARDVLHDPRFADEPVRGEELCSLEVEISVIAPLRPANAPLDFDPMRDGLYLIWEDRAGCFLPQVARETGWDRERLLNRLCTEKLGLPPDAWRQPQARLLLFATLTIGPEPLVPRS